MYVILFFLFFYRLIARYKFVFLFSTMNASWIRRMPGISLRNCFSPIQHLVQPSHTLLPYRCVSTVKDVSNILNDSNISNVSDASNPFLTQHHDAQTEHHVFKFLTNISSELCLGAFGGRNNFHTFGIFGYKKGTTMDQPSLSGWAATISFEDTQRLIPLSVSLKPIAQSAASPPESKFSRVSIFDAAQAELATRGMFFSSAKHLSKGEALLQSLKQHDKMLLLVVDSFHELFDKGDCANPENVLEKSLSLFDNRASEVLDELYFLGRQKSGRVALVLCGFPSVKFSMQVWDVFPYF